MRTSRTVAAVVLALVGFAVWILPGAAPAHAAPSLTVETITWNVIGIDSNDVTTGPATYPVGIRICNNGTDPATLTTATFAWTTASSAIDLDGPATLALGTIGAGACRDAYWNVAVARSASSRQTTRSYEIRVTSAEGATATTPTPREVYVEALISQNRNSVNSITGPTSVTVGEEVTYTVDANTAPAGFEQLEAFLTLPSSIFQLLRVGVTYEKPVGATNDTMYADACGWDAVPTSTTYRTCIGPEGYPGGKVGGALVSTFTVRVIGSGTAELTSAIYDKSGASYHYNTDFTVRPNILVVTASAPPAPTTTSPQPTAPTTVPEATTSTPTTAAVAPAAAETTATPAVAETAATPQSPLARPATAPRVATTGRSTGTMSLLGMAMLAIGFVAVAAARVGERGARPTSFERCLHDLRRTLHGREPDQAVVSAWLMMDALDRVADALRDTDGPS